MPLSTIDPAALARLTPGELANLALSADQSARLARSRGRLAEAAEHDLEASRLAALSAKRGAY